MSHYKVGDKVAFATNGGFSWASPRELYYGIVKEEASEGDSLRIEIKKRGGKGSLRPLGSPLSRKHAWHFFEEELEPYKPEKTK